MGTTDPTPEQLRIAFILPRASDRPVGALKVIYQHADQFAGRGQIVTLAHPRSQDLPAYVRDPHPWFSFHNVGARSLLTPGLSAEHLPGQFDITIATAWQTVPAVQALPARFGVKVYFLQDHESYLLGTPAERAAMARTFTVPWPIVVNNEPVERLLGEVAGRQPHKIPCAIDTTAFGLDTPLDSKQRQLIGFPARTEQAKRTCDAIAALELMRSRIPTDQRPDIWCFGAYPRHRLPSWVDHYATPTDQELRYLYNHTAIFIVSSLHEGFGLPGAEAMACGAALISTRNGGVDAYAAHGESAWLCPVRSPEALATATCMLLTDASLRIRIAGAGVAKATQFRPDDAAAAFESVLRDVVRTGNHAKPVRRMASVTTNREHSTASEQVRRLHRETVVIDTLAGGPGVLTPALHAQIASLNEKLPQPEFFRETERLTTAAFLSGEFSQYWEAIRTSMVDVLSVTVGAWGDTPFSFRGAVYDLGEWHRRFTAVPQFAPIMNPADLHVMKRTHRTGILLGFQNISQLEHDVRNVETFHGLGIRMMQLTYNDRSDAGDGCTQAVDEGLTSFGRELIRSMNDLGLIVDVSHCGPRTTMEAISWSRAPIAVSHAACAALYAHQRNKGDDILRAIADTGGYLGICAVPAFLTDQRLRRPSVAVMIEHIFHAIDICGEDHVGIGSDWGVADTPEPVLARLRAESRSRGFRDEHQFDFASTTEGFENWAAGFARITQGLLDTGLSAETIRGVLGGNFCSFYDRVARA